MITEAAHGIEEMPRMGSRLSRKTVADLRAAITCRISRTRPLPEAISIGSPGRTAAEYLECFTHRRRGEETLDERIILKTRGNRLYDFS
jgi:hypothetical protein